MSQTYYPTNNDDYVAELVQQNFKKLEEKKQLRNAIYNPKTGWIHVQPQEYVRNEHEPEPFDWANCPKVISTKEYDNLQTRLKSGSINDDQAEFGFYSKEFADEALRYHEQIKLHGAAVITSTAFPAITVTTVNQALLNRQNLVTQKYNLLGVPKKISTDQLTVIFPEYNDTQNTVRVGYRENDAIDTVGYGAFTQTSIEMKKAGAGIAFTEEYYMRQFTIPIESFIMDKIAADFVKARYDRIVAKLPSFTDVGTLGAWGAYTAGNLQSTNRPVRDLNVVKIAINADKLATANTIISNESVFTDYVTNTWTRGFAQADTAATATPNGNNIITSPPGIPWCKQWILNEDMPANTAYVLYDEALINIEGPRKTTQAQLYNPDQTAFFQKEWFDVILTTARTAWGRELTGV
jgi:hypothetical protein